MLDCSHPLISRTYYKNLEPLSFWGENLASLTLDSGHVATNILGTGSLRSTCHMRTQPKEELPSGYLQELKARYPDIWVKGSPPGLAAHWPRIIVYFINSVISVQVKQQPHGLGGQEGDSQTHQLIQGGRNSCPLPLLMEPSFAPCLEARTPDCRPGQDLREVNKWVEAIHPTVQTFIPS